ncbi:hypothetical protein AAF712_012448 [Marasmius tenuissimus]|uniref:Uncharacterized protein n=1 Tax=Marasmius tenuissimus TaxID=585030 RepID=A0ABR2ZHM5_9AGAR
MCFPSSLLALLPSPPSNMDILKLTQQNHNSDKQLSLGSAVDKTNMMDNMGTGTKPRQGSYTENSTRSLRVSRAENSTPAMDEARADGESGLMYSVCLARSMVFSSLHFVAYTSLATLIALFFVALTIVLRGRRAERWRMRILEEAIQNETYALVGRKNDEDVLDKPVLWETVAVPA